MNSAPQFFSSLIAAILLSANHSAAADQTIPGNLTVSGWGKFNDGIDIGANADAGVNWLGDKTTAFDIVAAQGVFLWRDSIVTSPLVSAKNKMQLNGDNSLTLYKSDGSPGIVISPETGKITLPAGSNSGIYFGGNTTSTLKADTNGAAVFASKVLFENGADFGSGNTLNSSNVQNLKSTLKNLGYSETPSYATPISSIKTSGNIRIRRIVGAGNYQYAVGQFDSQATIGTVSLYEWGTGSAGFVAKCDANGSVVWAQPIRCSNGYCQATNVSINSSGVVAVVGSFNGTTSDFGLGKELISNQTDGFIAVYNSLGVVLWTKAIGGGGMDYMQSVAIDANGAVTAGGTFEGSTTTLAPMNLLSAGLTDAIVVKFSSSGAITWAKQIGGPGSDSICSVTTDSGGNVLASGRFSGAITTLDSANRTGASWQNGYLVKLNGSDGHALWSKSMGGSNCDTISGHVQDSAGNVIVFGSFSGSTTTLEADKNLTAVGTTYDWDGIVLKINASGVTQWSKAIGGPGYQVLSSATVAADGKIVVAGSFLGSTTTLGTGLNISTTGTSPDILWVQLDPTTGSVTKAQALGAPNADAASLSVIGAAGFCMTGSTSDTFALGNTRMVPDAFNASWQGFDVITPGPSSPSAFSWSGGLASGTGSIAIGNQAYASGLNSSALGNSSATGDSSFAAGKGFACGTSSVAIGSGCKAMGEGSLALGESNVTSGNASSSIGCYNWNYGSGSYAIGQGNCISRDSGFAFGECNTLTGSSYGGISIGLCNGNYGDSGMCSTALGVDSTAMGDYSAALGMSAVSYSYMNTALGTGNVGGGNATSWVETDPLLELGNEMWGGWNPIENRSNAITTLKNGQTTLTNKAWKSDPEVVPCEANSNGNGLVVEGHTVLKGNTVLKGKVVIEQPQGDISMGIYGN